LSGHRLRLRNRLRIQDIRILSLLGNYICQIALFNDHGVFLIISEVTISFVMSKLFHQCGR
jgi:hypothetical protein